MHLIERRLAIFFLLLFLLFITVRSIDQNDPDEIQRISSRAL